MAGAIRAVAATSPESSIVGEIWRIPCSAGNGWRIGMVTADRGLRMRVMTRYNHGTDGIIAHEELWEKSGAVCVLRADGTVAL
jgi:hypothetical protein